MKSLFLSILLALFVATPVMAEKPEWAGKGKPTAEQKEAHKSFMKNKGKMEDEYEDSSGKIKKEKKLKDKKSKEEKDHDDEYEDAKDKMEKNEKSTSGKDRDDEYEEAMEKMKKEREAKLDKGREGDRESKVRAMEEESKGLDRQKSMKTEQERKELGMGSDEGQTTRETQGKKWWKLW